MMKTTATHLAILVTMILGGTPLSASDAIRQFTKSGKSGQFSYSVYNNRWLRKPEGAPDRVSITGVSPDAKGHLVIPPALAGCEVYGIEEKALVACTGIESVSIPVTLRSLKPSALNRCPSLKTIHAAEDHPDFASVDGALFNKLKTSLLALGGGRIGDYTVPATTTAIGPGAFSHCTKLKSVVIPKGVTDIGGRRGSVFLGCTNLERIVIPDTVTKIGQKSFQDCSSLKQVTIPPKVTEIPFGVFWRCTSLTSVTLPDGIATIGNYAFADSGKLTLKSLPKSLTTVGAYAFKNCKGLKGLTVPKSVTKIARGAFMGCDVVLPKFEGK